MHQPLAGTTPPCFCYTRKGRLHDIRRTLAANRTSQPEAERTGDSTHNSDSRESCKSGRRRALGKENLLEITFRQYHGLVRIRRSASNCAHTNGPQYRCACSSNVIAMMSHAKTNVHGKLYTKTPFLRPRDGAIRALRLLVCIAFAQLSVRALNTAK